MERTSQPATAGSFDAFFEKQAKEWKIPAEDTARVRSVVDTAIEYVTANANGPVDIQVGSDTFDILVTLRYMGNLSSLPDARPKKEMVEEQSFVSARSSKPASQGAPRGDFAQVRKKSSPLAMVNRLWPSPRPVLSRGKIRRNVLDGLYRGRRSQQTVPLRAIRRLILLRHKRNRVAGGRGVD